MFVDNLVVANLNEKLTALDNVTRTETGRTKDKTFGPPLITEAAVITTPELRLCVLGISSGKKPWPCAAPRD